eukprot:4349368-Amphidinium_carterae.1
MHLHSARPHLLHRLWACTAARPGQRPGRRHAPPLGGLGSSSTMAPMRQSVLGSPPSTRRPPRPPA